jgi:NAD+ diphosphatase
VHRLLTASLPLSRYRIDRDHATRERPHVFDELWADPGTRVLALWRGEVLLTPAQEPAIEFLRPDRVPDDCLRIYLGRTVEDDPVGGIPVGSPIVAVVLDDATGTALASDIVRWGNPRTFGHQLGDRDAGLAIEALGIANWHASHEFSPHTGNRTEPGRAGWVRVDVDTGREIFPRTDAAIIVAVTDELDRIVLGSNAEWESNRFSLLAGFVEPGESLEAAVVREVFEESGLRVTDPQYVGSQPWPFPASLMLGFRARLDAAHTATLHPDGTEIVDLRWFSRDELQASLPDIVLPSRTSIARAIIEDWFGGPLETSPW